MKKVIGLGGVFFKCKDPEAQKKWYREHLGIESESWGAQFFYKQESENGKHDYNVWSPFKSDTPYFNPSQSTFMINYRVDNLDALLVELQKSGIDLVGHPEESEFGKFAWIMDPEGNKLELWEPPK